MKAPASRVGSRIRGRVGRRSGIIADSQGPRSNSGISFARVRFLLRVPIGWGYGVLGRDLAAGAGEAGRTGRGAARRGDGSTLVRRILVEWRRLRASLNVTSPKA